jgi:hypothetical protein
MYVVKASHHGRGTVTSAANLDLNNGDGGL